MHVMLAKYRYIRDPSSFKERISFRLFFSLHHSGQDRCGTVLKDWATHPAAGANSGE